MFDGAAGSAFFAVLLCVLFLASCFRGLVGVFHLFLRQSVSEDIKPAAGPHSILLDV